MVIEDLGRAPYLPVLDRMRALHAEVASGAAPGRILLVEHESVYTAGRATPPAELTDDVVAIERGGKVTWHGPGQLTVYPVVPLPKRDVRDWLQRLERFGIAVCAEFGLAAQASVDGTGVFVGNRKVASIGVAVQRWVNLHGIGINVCVAGSPWSRVRPCGLDPSVMTDLSTVAGAPVAMEQAKAAVARAAFVLAGETTAR